jgi:predicted RNA-binding Zn ribbon-like protein
MQPLFLGGHPFVDFLNTQFMPQGEPIETIGDGKAFVDWLVTAGLLDQATAAKMTARRWTADANAAAAEARRVREWAREWLDRRRSKPKASYEEELRELNLLLERAYLRRRVEGKGGDLEVVETLRIETPEDLIGLVATQLSTFLALEDPSLLKACAGDGCTLWFLDRTKGHRRIYCSAAACGNRAKVSAFRARLSAR